MNEVISTTDLTYYSNRSIAEVQALQDEISNVIPAGNIVGLVLGGLTRLRGRTLPPGQARSDVSALLRGLEMLPRHILPGTLYGTFFVGPAAVLSAYQKLLELAGKEPASAFPDGLWQFYLEFALREDSARHTNETTGFFQALRHYDLRLSPQDQLAAWVCAVSRKYFHYDDLLYNEWRERVYLNLFEQVINRADLSHKVSFQCLPQAWAAQRPYRRGQDASPDETYSEYRRRRFDAFCQPRLELLSAGQQHDLSEIYRNREEQELAAYQQQMTILATLDPDRYRENRTPIPLWQARVGIIYQRRYYLLPACQTDPGGRPLLFQSLEPDAPFWPLDADAREVLHDRNGRTLRLDRSGRICDDSTGELCGYLRPAHFQEIRRQVAAIFAHRPAPGKASGPARLDDQLISIPRSEQERARKTLDPTARREIEALKYAPVLINWDEQDASKPLAQIRQAKRGIGDHVLTIFNTGSSTVFDHSHIFFDGAWSMALAEILSGEAVSWAAYFSRLEAAEPSGVRPYQPVLAACPGLEGFPGLTSVEVSAESTGVDVRAVYILCKLLPKRHPHLKLTVNDLLILYRGEFGREYRPSARVEQALLALKAGDTPEAREVYILIQRALNHSRAGNPSIMIPMDATAVNPRERLYPTTFRNPFTEFWSIYQHAAESFRQYRAGQTQEEWVIFTEARLALLAQLNYFGQLLRAYKKVALEGGSTSTATMKLMAHLPDSLLKLLDEIPKRIDILNEVLKGEEVFSNVGRVARGSSLTRFVSAKDDNENKALVWGIITDNNEIMHISLRDFRAHVAGLCQMNRTDLAEMLAQDYLDAFVTGFNRFVRQLLDLLNATASHIPRELTP